MSLVRTMRILASQRPSLPPRAVADPSRVRRVRHDRVPVTWIDPGLASTATIVHLHGGAYVQGESRQTWEWLEEVARRSGAAAAMIHYRLAPRHPYPAAVDDVLAALADMQREAVLRPGRWVLSGDGAGGGLALAVAQSLAGSGADAPAAVLLESPWSDLSREDHGQESLRVAARLYAGAVPRTQPRLSPVHGDLAGLPPVHLVTGAEDPLVGTAGAWPPRSSTPAPSTTSSSSPTAAIRSPSPGRGRRRSRRGASRSAPCARRSASTSPPRTDDVPEDLTLFVFSGGGASLWPWTQGTGLWAGT